MPNVVKFRAPEKELGIAPLTVKVEVNGALLGSLRIRRGGIVWRDPGFASGYVINWTKFAEFMREEGEFQG